MQMPDPEMPRPITEDDVSAALALAPPGQAGDQGAEAVGSVRPAAVLCGLVPRAAGLGVVLTRRAAHLRNHAGQISFPGGRLDPGDPDALAAALRESQEEIGLAAGQVRVLGELDSYLTITGFRVRPFVGIVDPRFEAQPDRAEVDLVFEAPLDFLMDPVNRQRSSYMRGAERRHYWAMPWDGHYIWGATAAMLKGLSDRLGRVAAAGSPAEGAG